MSEERDKKPGLVPRLRFPEFREAGEWEVIPLKMLGNFFRGLTYSANEISESGLLVIRSANIQDGNLVLDKDLVFVTKQCPDDIRLRVGDIVICMSNGSKVLVGKSAEFRGNYDSEITVGAFCSIFRPRIDFAKLIFQTKNFSTFISLKISGGNINNLKNSDLEDFEHPIPKSKQEQQKIADCLSSLDEKIAAETQRLDSLKTHKKGLMQQLFPAEGETVPRLRFPEFREEWALSSMSEIYSFKGNNSLSRDKLNYTGGLFRNIHYGDIHTKFSLHFRADAEYVPYINYGESHSTIRPENYCIAGDMVFADASEDLEDIGKAIEIIEPGNVPLVSGLHTILARPNESVLAVGFGAYLFLSESVRKQVQRQAQGAKVLGLSAKRLGNVKLPYPRQVAEQQKIVDCLSALDDLIAAQAQKIELLKRHKKGLMQQLFPVLDEAAA